MIWVFLLDFIIFFVDLLITFELSGDKNIYVILYTNCYVRNLLRDGVVDFW